MTHSLEKVVVRRGADVGSDHHLLLGKIKMHLRKALKRSESTRTKYHTARLRDPGVQKKFSLTLRKRSQTLGHIGDGLKNNWNAFRDIIIQTSADVLGTKTRSDKDWIKLDTWGEELLNRKKNQNARSERVTAKYSKEYSECNKETKKKLRTDKGSILKQKPMKQKRQQKQANIGRFSKLQKNCLGNNSGSSIIKDKNGYKITLDEKQQERWAVHLSKVLNRQMPSAFPDRDEAIVDTLETFETNLEPPTKDEIIRAIKSLTNNKAISKNNAIEKDITNK